MSQTRPPCRLFVIMARDYPTGVVFRRGPSDWYHVIKWDTERDKFEHGSWFHGKLYPDRCDISPDGRLLLYFALKMNNQHGDGNFAWTAVSWLPWLHAIARWPQNSTWGGGGRFIDNLTIKLDGNEDGWPPFCDPAHQPRNLCAYVGACEERTNGEMVEGAEWSGEDYNGRCVYCRDGSIFERTPDGDREIACFNDLEPDPQPAPDWARRIL